MSDIGSGARKYGIEYLSRVILSGPSKRSLSIGNVTRWFVDRR